MSLPIELTGSVADLTGTLGAAHTIPYGPDGLPLALADKEVIPAGQHGIPQAVQNDGIARLARGDVLGSQAIARFKQIFADLVDGTAVNTQLWTQSLTTMTVTQATREAILNAGLSVASGAFAVQTSIRQAAKPLGQVLRVTLRARFNWIGTNSVIEAGWCTPSGVVAAVSNGAFLRVNGAGEVRAVVSYNSGERQSDVLAVIGAAANQIDPSHWYSVDLFVKDDSVRFVVQRSISEINEGAAEAPVIDYVHRFARGTIAEWNAIAMPIAFRVYNSGASSGATRLHYSSVAAMVYDIDSGQPWEEQMAVTGRGVLMNPANGNQLANYANSAAPGSATLSNTAAGYTTLGGQYQFAAVAGAETDYALFAFTVPTGRTLVVTGVRIECFNTVVAVGATGTVMQWSIGRANAVTLAANSFRRTIGVQSFAAAAPVGAAAAPVPWTGTLSVDSGQVFHVILKMPIGLATATEIFRGTVDVNGYFE